jgi:hypothetical protein
MFVMGQAPMSPGTLESRIRRRSSVVTPCVTKFDEAEVRTPPPAVAPSVLGSPAAEPTWIRGDAGRAPKLNSL